jgi:hypothetical protein
MNNRQRPLRGFFIGMPVLVLGSSVILAACKNASGSSADATTSTTPTSTTIAGTGGTSGYSGDNSVATSATLNYPFGVAVDSSESSPVAYASGRENH